MKRRGMAGAIKEGVASLQEKRRAARKKKTGRRF